MGDRRFYRPELDALRFFAFLAVFFHHALPVDIAHYVNAGIPASAARWLVSAKTAGGLGVDLFFTLSSYLITELLIREHQSRGRIHVCAFYIRRALRIWPLYFTFLAATILLIPHLLPDEDFSWKYAVPFALFGGNWAAALWGLPFSVASPLWSVSIEEQFYLAWPLLILCFGVERIRRVAVILLVVAWVTRIILAAFEVGHPGVWCNTFARLDPIACGALIAVGLKGRAPNLNTASRVALICGGLAVWILVSRYLNFDGPSSLITYPAVAAGCMMILLATLQPDARRFQRAPLSSFVYLGRISYGLYVFHLLVLTVMAQQLFVPLIGLPLNFELRLSYSFLLTVLLAAASYRWLEQPFLRLKDRFTYVPSRDAQSQAPPAPPEVKGVVVGS